MLILLAQQIPCALCRFLDLEADVDDNDDNVGGGLEDNKFSLLIIPQIIFHDTKIYVDDFINNDKDPAGLDEASTQQQLSWMQLPDQENRFGQLLTEILALCVRKTLKLKFLFFFIYFCPVDPKHNSKHSQSDCGNYNSHACKYSIVYMPVCTHPCSMIKYSTIYVT